MPDTTLPGALTGIRVIEAGLLVQGPQASAMLAQMGADVVKVELSGFGDQARWLPLALDDFRSAYFHACNRGKRSVGLDLRHPAGAEVFRRLADSADVVISNFKPGTMDGWGLGYAELAARNPGLVYAAGSAFGPLGPDAQREGADLSGQAAGGLISTTGRDGEPPTPVAATVADHSAAQNLTSGILAALLARTRTGRGQCVEVSLLGSQIWAQASEYTYYLLSGRLPGRANGGNPMIPGLYGMVPTSDGWLAIVGVVGDQRPRFFDAIGRPDILEDPRFASPLLGPTQKAELFAELATVFAQRTTAAWAEVLTAAGQRFAPVRDYAQVVADPQPWVNGYLQKAVGPDGRETTVVGTPIGFSDTPATVGTPAPELGQNTEEVLLEAGYTWEEIEELRAQGAI
jgi:crotonobetainyl-CoA:carnitine CoA-transferase CaiB-like acyl-CoA transferase